MYVAFPISLLSMGGVCGRSLTAGKILFTGRQTCSLYLVLSLCAANMISINIVLEVLEQRNLMKVFYYHSYPLFELLSLPIVQVLASLLTSLPQVGGPPCPASEGLGILR